MKKSLALSLSLFLTLAFLVFLVFSLFPVPENGAVLPDRVWQAEDARLDLNRASAEELQEISGIGPVLSEAIVAWREENGPFVREEDLLQIPGIGEKTVAALRGSVIIGGSNEDSGRG